MNTIDCVLERCCECTWDEESETYFCSAYGCEVTKYFQCEEEDED